MDRYVVMGNPIGHSLSPRIHALFASETGQEIEYGALLVPGGEFARAADEFVAGGGRGFNVTLPFKQDAWRWAQERSSEAELCGAVNTVVVTARGSCRGHNTDGMGLVADLAGNLGWRVEGARVLVAGAGGAAAGILYALLNERPAEVVVANRTPARATWLADQWRSYGRVLACPFEELQGPFDLVINATSASLAGELPALPTRVLGVATRCYDLMYSASATVFNRWAEGHGAVAVSDGLGMLVEQAAAAFELWRGVRPTTAAVRESLRAGLVT